MNSSSNEKDSLLSLFHSGLQKEIEAEKNAKKLMELFKNNGINLEMSTKINDDELKHQMIVKNIIDTIENN